jgi:hypothetical protein
MWLHTMCHRVPWHVPTTNQLPFVQVAAMPPAYPRLQLPWHVVPLLVLPAPQGQLTPAAMLGGLGHAARWDEAVQRQQQPTSQQ